MKKLKIGKESWIFLIAICVSFCFIRGNYLYKKNLEEARIKAKIERSKEEAQKAEEAKVEEIPKDISDTEVIKYLKEFQKEQRAIKDITKLLKIQKNIIPMS